MTENDVQDQPGIGEAVSPIDDPDGATLRVPFDDFPSEANSPLDATDPDAEAAEAEAEAEVEVKASRKGAKRAPDA